MPAPHVLITRPQPDASKFERELEEAGFHPIIEPLLEILPKPDAHKAIESALEGLIQGIILTSRHALKALAGMQAVQDIPLYVVGPITAAAAKKAHFTNIRIPSETEGGAEKLVEFIRYTCHPSGGKFIYLSGEDIRLDIGASLAQQGFVSERIVVYTAQSAETLSLTLQEALKNGDIDIATFFSARTAALFCELVTRTGIASECINVSAIALSKEVAKELHQLPFKNISYPKVPTSESLITHIQNYDSIQ